MNLCPPRCKPRWAPCGRRETFQDYYWTREATGEATEYWQPKRDPDGRLRDRFSNAERQSFLSDHADMLEMIEAIQPDRVLDFGAGPGWLLREISAEHKSAVEIDPRAIAELQSHEIAVHGDLLGLEPASYDLVIANHVIEHLVDPIGDLRLLRNCLVPGGWLILGTPDFGSPCAQRFGSNYRMLHDPTHISLFTLESCTRFLRDNAFTIEEVRFPFPERFNTIETWLRWSDTSKVSPPWPGNWMTFYCTR